MSKDSSIAYVGHVVALILHIPVSIYSNVATLCDLLGIRFVSTCVIIYGLQQGLSNSWFFQARDYYFKDHLGLEPAVAQTYAAISLIPWSMKPLYGMASDFVPVFGYHRVPYICFAGALSTLCFILLYLLPLSAKLAVVLLFCANLSVATPDVMIDGMIAEHTKRHPKHSTDLQSLLWGSLSLFAILGFLTSGFLVSSIGPKNIFGVLTFIGVLILTAGLRNWVGERPKSHQAVFSPTEPAHAAVADDIDTEGDNGQRSKVNIVTYFGCIQLDLDFVAQYKSLLNLSLFLAIMALVLGALVLLFDEFEARVSMVVVIAISVLGAVIYTLRAQYSVIRRTALFLFSIQAMVPDIDTAMFYWYTNYENGPQFDPQLIGYVSAFSFGAMFVGILIFNRYLGDWQFRNIFYVFLTLAALLAIPDMILVLRLNIRYGVPDELLVFGEAAVAPIIRRCMTLPMFIIAAKVCPTGAEATVFAMLTALSNFGAAVSSYFGATLLTVFGVQGGNYDNLKWIIIVKCCCRLLTLLLVPAFIPIGTPSDSDDSLLIDDAKSWEDTSSNATDAHDAERQDSSQHGLMSLSVRSEINSSTAHVRTIGPKDTPQPEFRRNPLFNFSDTHTPNSSDVQLIGLINPSSSGTAQLRARRPTARDQLELNTTVDTSRYFQYISPHANFTTQSTM